ncbi:hypothetical protein HDU92_002613 [Lobulomyces angularis]|nr:hypothetical protein HDU92_002613 [Lobulomyces angularis]
MDQNAINEYIEKDLIDFEFLDEYSDNHPPESIKFLDKKIDEMVGNIASLLESRKKDFQNTPGRKDRLPVQPDTNFYENYQESRKEKLKDALHVEIPVQRYTSSQLVSKQLEIYWDVNKEFRIDNIRKLLRNFFKTKAYSCIQENFLLLSRWSRFCKSTSEPTKYKLQFQKHVQYLKKEFLDSIDRYERINECVVKKDALIKEAAILKQKDLEKNERLGFAVNRRSSMKPMIEKGNEKEDKKNITPVMREVTEEIKLEANDLEVGDLAIYLRHLISTYKPIQTMDLFLTRAKMLSIADREYWLKDYHLISHLKPGVPNDLPTYKFEGFDNFTEKFPLKNPRLEDFLNEFETLVTAFGIETQIGREDGRPFAFEIATKFSKLFSIHQKENLLPPYDFYFEDLTFSNSNPNVIQPASSEIGRGTKKPETYNPRINWSDLMDEKTRATFINPTTLRLRQADWLDQNEYFPRLEIWQERQKAILQSQKEIDFEVGYEYDVLLCNDIEVVKQKLREAAKGLCEIEDDSTYRKNKVNLNKQQGEETETDRISEFEECLRNKKPFDYGMLITDSRNTNEVDIVLEAKRTLCQKNEEIKRIEQELLELDPTRAGSVGQQIEPATVSNVFAEHEIFSFLLLKDLKIREHRSSLLNQLNFFRSIEKRICHDTKFLQQMKNTTFTDHMDKPYQGNVKVASFMSNMWKNQYFFDASDQSFCETSSISSFLDDIRIIHNNKIFVMDSNDTRFIYDVAVKDLKELEKEIIKIATIFINSDSLGNEKVSKKYMETLKFKLADRRVDSTVSTFYNPEIDRAQLLMELYDYECKFGNAKVQALLSQGDTVMKILKHHIKENRGVINKYFFKLHKAMLDPDMEYPFELTDDKENFDFSKFIDTPLTIGLPLKPEKEKEMITMHQSGVSVFFGEFSSALDKIAEVYECSRYCLVEMSQALEQITSNDSTDLGSIECIIWKNFNTIWSSFALQNFESWKSKKIDRITSYENESGWFENPLFPDAFLSEKYSLFKSNQKEQWNKEGLFSAFTMFNDPSFQTKGCSFLINMLKLLTLKKRLFLTGTESEFWKKTFENQCLQMGVSKKGIVGKLCPLKFDLLDFVDIKNLDEDDIECGESDGEDEVFEQKSVEAFNVSLKCGPLAISEIDESLGSLAGSSFSEIFDALKEPFLEKLSRALKIQLIEMYNCLAVSQMNSHILCEINLKYLTEGYPSKEKKMALKKKPNGKDTIELQRFDFDYKALIPSLLSKKKFVRKCCLQEYVKE